MRDVGIKKGALEEHIFRKHGVHTCSHPPCWPPCRRARPPRQGWPPSWWAPLPTSGCSTPSWASPTSPRSLATPSHFRAHWSSVQKYCHCFFTSVPTNVIRRRTLRNTGTCVRRAAVVGQLEREGAQRYDRLPLSRSPPIPHRRESRSRAPTSALQSFQGNRQKWEELLKVKKNSCPPPSFAFFVQHSQSSGRRFGFLVDEIEFLLQQTTFYWGKVGSAS